jgi:dephospho-CoA kinase
MRRPYVVGICGGIGSGKSTAARVFARLGARILDADRIAHEVLDEPAVKDALRARFGDGVLEGGAVSRKALERLVFGGTPEHAASRAALEAIVHPRILARIEAGLAEARAAASPPPVVVIDAPLLTEGPLRAACDEIVFVDAPEAARVARTATDRGWAPGQHLAREQAQSNLDAKRAASTVTITNAGSPADLERACEALWSRWTKAR